MKVDLSLIRTDGGTQPRAGIDQAVVSEYAEAMEAGDTFPPLTIFHDGMTYWLTDGFHRYHAHAKLEAREVEADVRQGQRRDAVLYSAGANATHGLRRTNEDKRRAVTVLLNDAEWSKWSDREIAKRAGVGNKFVGDIRRAICVPNTDERKVKRGDSEYTVQTVNIGKPKADLSEYTQPRPQPGYNPPRLPDTPEEADEEDAELVAPRKIDLVTGEGIIREDAPLELIEAANQPVPTETPETRMREALKRDRYDEAEKLGKQLTALLGYEPRQVTEIISSPSGQVLGLPRLQKMVLQELQQKTLTVS